LLRALIVSLGYLWFSIQISKFSNCQKHFLKCYGTQISIHNRQFEPLISKGKTQWQFKNIEIYKDLYGKPLKHHWVARVVFLIQILIFGGRCNRCFWDIRTRIHGLLNFNLLFKLLLTHPKTNFYRVYRRLITWPKGLQHILCYTSMFWRKTEFQLNKNFHKMEWTTYNEEVFSFSRLFSSNIFPVEKPQNASFDSHMPPAWVLLGVRLPRQAYTKYYPPAFSWAPLALSPRAWNSKKTLGYQDFMSWWRRGLNGSCTKRCVSGFCTRNLTWSMEWNNQDRQKTTSKCE